MLKFLLAAIVVGTWNTQWFPSGRAKHRAHPDVEAATVKAAGALLRKGIATLDPAGTNDVILCLGEIRGPRAAQALCDAVGRTNLSVAVVTRYRWRDRFDEQQDVILTTLPVAQANWSVWKSSKGVRPPRGRAHARLIIAPAVTAAVYAVHLKSNYHAVTENQRADNREKRRLAVEQLVAGEKPRRGRRADPVVIAGDFNADRWRAEFAGETLFATLASAGFLNVLERLPPAARGTHPNRKWGDSALDYIFLRGLAAEGPARIISAEGLSDHNPVFQLVSLDGR
jgi:endonuclease/exonuclease/phosphatase family metal-dependent hydrolase